MSVLFCDVDRNLIENSKYDPNNKPSFEYLRFLLVWRDDELPSDLSPNGRDMIYSLLIARNYIFHLPQIGRKPPLLPNERMRDWVELWDGALAERIGWCGFRRMELDDVDKRYFLLEYEKAMHDEEL